MCGIAGLYYKDKEIDRNVFDRMVDIVIHRGPDGRGVFYDGRLAIGHRRLSIIEPNETGTQPFSYMDRYILTFNGEIYNYIELREELLEAGFEVKTKTDTEVLAASYACWGRECVHHLNGMWAFTIYDRKERTIFGSRDRFGVKPLYYLKTDNMFAFASEIKQILSLPEIKATADKDTLLRYIVCGESDYCERTMFEGILSLRPGHNFCYDIEKDGFTVYEYHNLRNVPEQRKSFKEDGEDFKTLFFNSVKIRLRSDVPLGYCLSGGLDSSSIVCCAEEILSGTEGCEKHSISSCFEDSEYDEREYIDEVVAKTNVISHQVFPDINNVLEELDKMVYHFDEPFLSTSCYSQWNVFREAKKQGLTVMLDGQGSDEQLAGYGMFYSVRFAELLRKFKLITLTREMRLYLGKCKTLFRDVRWQSVMLATAFGAIPIPDKMGRLIRANRVKKRYPFFSKEQIRHVFANYNSYDYGNTRRFTEDNIYQCLQINFHDEDRISMAFSMESRVPFMDYRLAERIFAMPFDSKIRDGITKAVLREGLKDVLPQKILHRYNKLGYASPEDRWMNDNAELIGKELEKALEILGAFLDKDAVMNWYRDSSGRIRRGDSVIWRIICAGRWVKVFGVELS